MLPGCRPTDFFTEVIISNMAEEVDEDNPDVLVVNSPDADDESTDLSALDWTDDSPRSEDVETLVTFSSDPTSDLATRNSIFSLAPMLSDVEASLGVRLVYDPDSLIDEETDEWLETDEDRDDTTENDAGSDSSEDTEEQSDEESASDAEGEASGEEATTSEGALEGTASDDGALEVAGGGYGGSVSVYNPNDAYAKVPEVDSLAVIGTQAAVMVQALGGEGAICAMSEEAYYGSGDADAGAATFAEVFADELSDDFEEDCLLFEDDGCDQGELVSVDALVEAIGTGGVIIYDQDLGDQDDFFTEDEKEALWDAGTTLVPVDFSTVQGTLDAAAAAADALRNSSSCKEDAYANYKAYKSAISSIVEGVCGMRSGGKLAAISASDTKNTMLTEYALSPVKKTKLYGTGGYPYVGYIATEVAVGWTWEGSGSLDPSGVLLLRPADYTSSPLAFWGQVAGVTSGYSTSTDADETGLELLWPYVYKSSSNLSGTGSVHTRWLASGTSSGSGASLQMTAGPSNPNSGLLIKSGYGLGSKYMPFLVVSATGDYSASDVREAVLESMESYSTYSAITGYSVMPYSDDSAGGMAGMPGGSLGWGSSIGSQNSDGAENPFLTGLDSAEVVRENPTGLLGSWTEGGFESVLEAVWLGVLYSCELDGCAYEAVNDASELTVEIAGVECTTLEECVEVFYETFYRLDADDAETCFDAAVPDALEDLL